MFTGIIEEIARVLSVEQDGNVAHLKLVIMMYVGKGRGPSESICDREESRSKNSVRYLGRP